MLCYSGWLLLFHQATNHLIELMLFGVHCPWKVHTSSNFAVNQSQVVPLITITIKHHAIPSIIFTCHSLFSESYMTTCYGCCSCYKAYLMSTHPYWPLYSCSQDLWDPLKYLLISLKYISKNKKFRCEIAVWYQLHEHVILTCFAQYYFRDI